MNSAILREGINKKTFEKINLDRFIKREEKMKEVKPVETNIDELAMKKLHNFWELVVNL